MGVAVSQWKIIYKNDSSQIWSTGHRLPVPDVDCYFGPALNDLPWTVVLAWCYIPMLMGLWRKNSRALLNILLKVLFSTPHGILLGGASLKDILLGSSTTKSYTSLEYLIYFSINGTIKHAPDQFSLVALADKKLRAR